MDAVFIVGVAKVETKVADFEGVEVEIDVARARVMIEDERVFMGVMA